MSRRIEGVACILLSATGFGLMPIFTNYAYRGGITIPSLLLIRFTLAAGLLFAYLLASRRPVRVSRGQLARLALLGGVGYTLQAGCYFAALRFIPASMVALLLYTYPIFVIALARLIDKEPISPVGMGAVAVALAGLAFVLAPSLDGANVLGMCLAVGGALVYSGYITLGNRVVKELPSVLTSAYVSLFAALSFLLFGLPSGTLQFGFGPGTWVAAVAVSLVSTVLAMITFFRGMELIGSTRASTISMVEPLITIGFASALFSERLTVMQMLGGACVLAGAAAVVLTKARAQEPSEN